MGHMEGEGWWGDEEEEEEKKSSSQEREVTIQQWWERSDVWKPLDPNSTTANNALSVDQHYYAVKPIKKGRVKRKKNNRSQRRSTDTTSTSHTFAPSLSKYLVKFSSSSTTKSKKISSNNNNKPRSEEEEGNWWDDGDQDNHHNDAPTLDDIMNLSSIPFSNDIEEDEDEEEKMMWDNEQQPSDDDLSSDLLSQALSDGPSSYEAMCKFYFEFRIVSIVFYLFILSKSFFTSFHDSQLTKPLIIIIVINWIGGCWGRCLGM